MGLVRGERGRSSSSDKFSLADLAVGSYLGSLKFMGYDYSPFKNVKARTQEAPAKRSRFWNAGQTFAASVPIRSGGL